MRATPPTHVSPRLSQRLVATAATVVMILSLATVPALADPGAKDAPPNEVFDLEPPPQRPGEPTANNIGAMSAGGCTAADGPTFGAQNCINVNGTGTYVSSSRSTYMYSYIPSPAPNPICGREHVVRMTPQYTNQKYDYQGPLGCHALPAIDSYIDYTSGWAAGRDMKHGTSYCGASKNNHTSYVWTNYACINITA